MDLIINPNIHEDSLNIQELHWDEVKGEIKAKNKELFSIIEALDPPKKLTFIKARYPYGASIVDNGIVYLPLKTGKSIPITMPFIDESIKKKLSYSPIPLGFLLNKASEVFVKSNNDRVIPLKLIPPGKLFGLFEIINILSGIKAEPIWCVSSGARSTYMLPKITDRLGYQRLRKELNIPLNPPNSLNDHWQLFTQISNHLTHINTWYSDVLFFTDGWFSKPYNDSKWTTFYNYFFREANIQSQPARDERLFNLTWQCLAIAIGSRNLRPRPYMADTVKHLMATAIGVLPAFRPTEQNEIALPTKLLQHIFVETYGLKNYLPTIMQPYNLVEGFEPKPVYYSLAYPSLLEGAPYHKLHPDIIADVREVKLLIDTLYSALQAGKVILPKAHSLLHKTKFEYFNTGKDIYNEVKSTKDLLNDDPNLANDKQIYQNLDFCFTAPFLSGCIRISMVP